MEFEDRKTMYFYAGLFGIIILIVTLACFKVYRYEQEQEQALTINERACAKLSLIYGDHVKITNGFYKGQSGVVVDYARYSDGTAMKVKLNSEMTVSVKCKDLSR